MLNCLMLTSCLCTVPSMIISLSCAIFGRGPGLVASIICHTSVALRVIPTTAEDRLAHILG